MKKHTTLSNLPIYIALFCATLIPPTVHATVEMQFELRVVTDSEAATAIARLTSPNFTSVYEEYLDLYGTTFNTTYANATAAVDNTQDIHQVAQLEVTLSGARVNSVVKNSNGEWVVEMGYQSAYNTFTSPFISRHAIVQSSDQSFDSSNHPCLQTFSPCCLLDYTRDYRTGNSFAAMVEGKLGNCLDAGILSTDTNVLFDTAMSDDFIDNTLTGVPGASITNPSVGILEIVLNPTALRNSVARITMDPDGSEKIEFFVGVTFLTMLPTNAIATTVSQMNIEISTKNYVEFATVTSQSFTPVRFTQISLEQIKYIDGVSDPVVELFPQSAKLLVVLRNGLTEDTSASLIPHDSIRWAIDESMPDITDESLWTIACSDQGYPANDQTVYEAALEQSCGNQNARAKGICAPSVVTDENGIGEIFIPLGLNTLTPALLSSESLTIFIQFNVMTEDGDGRKAVSTMYVQAPLATVSMIESCESLTQGDKLDEVTDMHIAVGFATDESTFNASCRVVDNIISGVNEGKAGFDGVIQPAESYADGLISLYITGDSTFFTPPTYEIFIEDLWTVHTRGASKTAEISTLFTTDQAFDVQTSFNGQTVEVEPQSPLTNVCLNDFSCVYRRDVRQRDVINAYAVHEHGSIDRAFDMDTTKEWLKGNILGYTPFSDALSQDFATYIRTRKDVNDRSNKLYFINPTHKWPSASYSTPQSLLLLSDTVFMYGIIVFDDGAGVRRRRLLTVGPDGASTVPIGSPQINSGVSSGEEGLLDLDRGFNRFRRIKEYLLNKVARSHGLRSRHIGKPTIVTTDMRNEIHKLALKKRLSNQRKMLSDTSNEEIIDYFTTDDGFSTGGYDDSFQMVKPDPNSARRALLQADTTTTGIDGNPYGTFVSLSIAAQPSLGLQIAEVVGATSNATWQIMSIDFQVSVDPSIANDQAAMDRAIYEAITERIAAHSSPSTGMQIFPGSHNMIVFHSPATAHVATSTKTEWHNLGTEKVLMSGEIQMVVTWPNGTDLRSITVSPDKIECAVWYDHTHKPTLTTAPGGVGGYKYCDTSTYHTGVKNKPVQMAVITSVEAWACGDMGVVSHNCVNMDPNYMAPPIQTPVDNGATLLQLRFPGVALNAFNDHIKTKFVDMIASEVFVPPTFITINSITDGPDTLVNVTIKVHSYTTPTEITTIRKKTTVDHINKMTNIYDMQGTPIPNLITVVHPLPVTTPVTTPTPVDPVDPVDPTPSPAPEDGPWMILVIILSVVLALIGLGLCFRLVRNRTKNFVPVGCKAQDLNISVVKPLLDQNTVVSLNTSSFFKNTNGIDF
jgi:hypothetical protein